MTFHTGQRVKITQKDHPLYGKTGTVSRCRITDDGAWITMDDDLPKECQSFPKEDARHRNILFFPEDCEPLP